MQKKIKTGKENLYNKKGRGGSNGVVGVRHMLVCCIICFALAFALTSCGDSDSDDGSAQKGPDTDSGVAKKYVDLLTDDDSEYYMTVESRQETGESDDVFTDVQTIAQAKDKQFVSSDANQTMQYSIEGYLYYYDVQAGTYYKMKQGSGADDITDAYAPRNGYKKTTEKEFAGQKCECDIYEKDLTEEGVSLVNITEYYVDGNGDLVGVISEQKNKTSDRLVSRVTMTVTGFKEKVPEGTFDLPDGYEEMTAQ